MRKHWTFNKIIKPTDTYHGGKCVIYSTCYNFLTLFGIKTKEDIHNMPLKVVEYQLQKYYNTINNQAVYI